MKEKLRCALNVARPPFLLLTLACLFPGMAIAWQQIGEISPLSLALLIIGALSAHISVNAINEYEDFRSGLDLLTERTPFNGGSGTLPGNPDLVGVVRVFGFVTLLLAIGCGLWLFLRVGREVLVLSLVGLLLILSYTRWINRLPLLCLIAPGVGFGLLMVNGAVLVLTGSFATEGFIVSLVMFFLVSGLLLLNQLPDIEADKQAGRNHLPICIGPKKSAAVFVGLLMAAYLTIVIGWYDGRLSVKTLLTCLTLPLAFLVAKGALAHASDIPRLLPTLGRNIVLTLSIPLLLGISLAI